MGNQDNSINVKSEVKGRGLFYGVIAVATFIVAAVGATFAYFTATTSSSNTAVTAGSTTLELKYISYESAWNNFDLIPADVNVVQWSFEKQNDTTLNKSDVGELYNPAEGNLLCKDDYGNSICSVYVFQIINTAASPQTLALSVVSNLNGFSNLHAIAYDVSVSNTEDYEKTDPRYEDLTEDSTTKGNGAKDPVFKSNVGDLTLNAVQVTNGSGAPLYQCSDGQNVFKADCYEKPIYVNRVGITKNLLNEVELSTGYAQSARLVPVGEDSSLTAEERTAKVASGFTVDSNATKTFALILFIENQNEDQTGLDADKTFSGQVIVGPDTDDSENGFIGVSGFIGAASTDNDDEEVGP